MSGLAVACGNANKNEVAAMMEKIAHRGPYTSAIHDGGQIILAQNYLKADGVSGSNGYEIPIRSQDNPERWCCKTGRDPA